MVIGQFFLVLAHAPVELVGQRVDRGVHVAVDRVGMNDRTAYPQCRLCPVLQFLDRQHAVHVNHVLEVAHDALQLFLT